jgi:prephenate dehydrogenase
MVARLGTVRNPEWPGSIVAIVLATLDRIAVIGLGLIGGSLLRALHGTGRDCWGYDADPAVLDLAGADGFEVVTTAADAVRDADLVILAMPLPQVPAALGAIAATLSPDAVLTDVGTLKRPVADAVRAATPGHRFVGGHPLAGTEDSGWRAGRADMFDGAPWSLCLEPGGPDEGIDAELSAWLAVAALVCEIGAHPVPTTAAEQDDAVARVIGLPHVLAEALALTGLAGGPLGLSLAAGSYTTGSRVARTRPELVASWCDRNHALVGALDEAIGLLTGARDALAAGDSVLPLAQRGHSARMAWEQRSVRTVPVGRGRAQLLAHGRQGGWITQVPDEGDLTGMRPR